MPACLAYFNELVGPWQNRRRCARQAAEHGAFHQAGPAGIIIEERAAGYFSGREKPADHVPAGILDLAFFGDADAAEGKCDAAGHREGVIRRRVQALRPVRFRRTDTARAFAVVLRGIERRVVDRIVERFDRFDDIFPIQARQFFRQRFDRIGADVKAAVVLGAQQRAGLAVENLIGRAPRQAQHFPAALRIGVAEEVLAFVDEAPAVDVDHDAVGIRVAVLVGAFDVGRLRVDQHRVAAAPMADRLGAEAQRQTEHLAGVIARAANFHQIPARTEIARAHFGIGLEAAGSQDHGSAREIH